MCRIRADESNIYIAVREGKLSKRANIPFQKKSFYTVMCVAERDDDLCDGKVW